MHLNFSKLIFLWKKPLENYIRMWLKLKSRSHSKTNIMECLCLGSLNIYDWKTRLLLLKSTTYLHKWSWIFLILKFTNDMNLDYTSELLINKFSIQKLFSHFYITVDDFKTLMWLIHGQVILCIKWKIKSSNKQRGILFFKPKKGYYN